MFRLRQQNQGVIQVLPDTPPVWPPVSLTVSSLQESAKSDSETLFSEATRGTAAARQVLSTANEAHVKAVETAQRLQQQTRQLENVAMLVEDTRAHLDSAEVTIEKLTKPVWRRKIRRRKATVRDRGSGDRKTVLTSVWRKEKENMHKLQSEGRQVVGVDHPQDSYDEFDGAVRDELLVQDELLNDASVVVEELGMLAIGIGKEIDKEVEIVEDIDVVEVTNRIRESNNKLRHRLKLK